MKALSLLFLAAILLTQTACTGTRRGDRVAGRTIVGAGVGAAVAGPVGAVAGGAVGAATTR